MPKTIELPNIKSSQTAVSPDVINTSVDQLSNLIPPQFQNNIPEYLEKIMMASSLGSFTMTNQQYSSLLSLFNKKVAAAPRQLDINQKVSVEHKIQKYLEDNGNSFSEAISLLPDARAREAEITRSLLSNVTEGEILNVE